MESIENLYEQYYNLLERIQENSSSVFAINLLQYDITQNYYSQVDRAVGLLKDFCEKYLKGADIEKAINERFQNSRVENIKFGLLIDVLRCCEFFKLFVDFKGYVDFFLLQDCVDDDYNVKFWLETPLFVSMPMPKDLDEYKKWIHSQLDFVDKRGKRIKEYCGIED